MKAITIKQPYAGLIAAGAKRFETRAWATAYRGQLAIHAAKADAPFWAPGVPGAMLAAPTVGNDWVRGAIIAVVALVAVHPVEHLRDIITDEERALGDYADGRWAWELASPVRLEAPMPWRGNQGLWRVDGEVLSTYLPYRAAP